MQLREACAALAMALTLAACVPQTRAVGITDLVWWGADLLANSAGSDGGQRDGSETETAETTETTATASGTGGSAGPRRTCHCSGPACMCCLDFNMTYIDLGGPGCVRLRYLGQDAGVAMNVSYGDSLLHSEVVKDSSPSQTCMDILSSLAQVCARFSSLEPLEAETETEAEAVKRGCLQLEPTLLGEVQASYSVGCFRMTPQSMTIEPQSAIPTPDTSQPEGEGSNTTEAPTPTTEISAETLIAAVSETAEQGIDLLTNWLGLALEDDNATTTEAAEGQEVSSTPAPSSARAYRQGWVSV